jgi:hypothetical protein
MLDAARLRILPDRPKYDAVFAIRIWGNLVLAGRAVLDFRLHRLNIAAIYRPLYLAQRLAHGLDLGC